MQRGSGAAEQHYDGDGPASSAVHRRRCRVTDVANAATAPPVLRSVVGSRAPRPVQRHRQCSAVADAGTGLRFWYELKAGAGTWTGLLRRRCSAVANAVPALAQRRRGLGGAQAGIGVSTGPVKGAGQQGSGAAVQRGRDVAGEVLTMAWLGLGLGLEDREGRDVV